MNRLYDTHVENIRAEREIASGSRNKISDMKSTPRDNVLERSEPDYYNNYPIDNADNPLDVIFENLNENFTRTDMIQSYQVWTQIANARELIRRAAR